MSLISIESLPEPTNPLEDEQVVELPMTAEDRRRVRRRLRASDGAELALSLPTGTNLAPGRVIHRGHGRCYVVTAASEDVIVIQPRDTSEAARVGHLIGNLHLGIDCTQEGITVLRDQPLEDRLKREGFVFAKERRPFHGNPASGHHHE